MVELDIILNELSRNFRWADVLDVLLATAFLFGLITGLRRDITPRALKGLGFVSISFLGLYKLSQVFGLYLIGLFVEVLFLVFLIGAVVVFQSDIRRLIDRATSFNIFRRDRPPDSNEETVDDLIEALETMADRQIGALIALKGTEPWERQLHGGIALDGEISLPLLYSLFNPTSPAHDGAVLIEANRVTRFAVHLPLSTRLAESTDHGTRHAAALGLSERTDALVLVVSEERGEISIAENGRLVEIGTTGELKRRLQSFWRQHRGETGDPRTYPRLFRNVRTAALSFGLAASLWLLFAYSPDLWYRSFDVPIVYENLPPEWTLVDPAPRSAEISVSGPERAFADFDSQNLTIVVDMGQPSEGFNRKLLSTDNLELPPDLTLVEIEPEEVEVEAQKLSPHRLPVEVPTVGRVPGDRELRALTARPDSITVLLPDDGIPIPHVLRTEPLDLTRVTESTKSTRSIVIPPGAKLETDAPSEVTVEVVLE